MSVTVKNVDGKNIPRESAAIGVCRLSWFLKVQVT